MHPLDVAHTYFDAWNRRDPAAIVSTFAEGGTYSDPTVPPLAAESHDRLYEWPVCGFPQPLV